MKDLEERLRDYVGARAKGVPEGEVHRIVDRAAARLGGDVSRSPRRLRALAAVAATLLTAVVATVALLAFHAHLLNAPATNPTPLRLTSTPRGVMTFHFVSAQVGWVTVFTPKGRTVLMKTADGGAHWQQQLEIDGLFPFPPMKFFNAQEGVIVAQPGADASFAPRVWSTADGGAHWQVRGVSAGSGRLVDADFVDMTHGWLLASDGPPGTSSRVFVYQTVDGGRRWTRLADSDSSSALGQSDAKTRIRFANQTTGWITSSSPQETASLYVTRDGGHSWQGLDLTPPADAPDPSRKFPYLERFFNEREAVLVLGVTARPDPACFSGPPADGNVKVKPVCVQPVTRYAYSTADGGRTWSAPRRIGSAGGALSFLDARRWFIVDAKGLSVSEDAGTTWSEARRVQLPSGWEPRQVEFIDPQRGWIAVQDRAGEWRAIVYSSQSPGKGPANFQLQGELPRLAMLVTADAGMHWTQVQLPDLT